MKARRRRRHLPPVDGRWFTDVGQRLDQLLGPAVDFWRSAVDWDGGGFYGRVDLRGRPDAAADKDLIQQMRHLWTFAELFRRWEPSPGMAEISDHQFRFVRDRFVDSSGRSLHSVVTADGRPTGDDVHHYSLAFGIFGLANHARAYSEAESGREAADLAFGIAGEMTDRSWHIETGFDETVYPSRWCRDPKEINTQMHLMEAVAELVDAGREHAHPAVDAFESILDRQVSLVAERAIVTEQGRTFCSRGYDHDWTVIDRHEIDYGHDIELGYLLHDAACALGRGSDPTVVDAVVRLGRSISDTAFDRRRGRWFYAGKPLTGEVTQRVANIWTNFEALNGLSTLYDLTGSEQALVRYERTLWWLEHRQRNDAVGEWYYNVDGRGRPMATDVFGAPCGWMSFAWKSSYHSVRALLNGIEWAAGHAVGPALAP